MCLRSRYKHAIPIRLNPSKVNVEGSGTVVIEVTVSAAVGADVLKVRRLTTLPEKDKNVPTSVGVRENMKKLLGKFTVNRSGTVPVSTTFTPIRVVVEVI